MDQDATWYAVRPRSRRHCVRWGPSSPRKGAEQPPPPTSPHVYYGQTVVHLSNCWSLVMVALWNRADHYIFTCGFFFLFLLLFSSPILSRRRLDVCHSSTHGVALVRISDAGLKRAARASLEMQDAKKSPKIVIWAQSHNFVRLYFRN